MRYLACAFLLTFVTLASAADEGVPTEKWGMDYPEKTWGMKLKSVTYQQRMANYSVVIELTKDLSAEELAAVKEAFSGKQIPGKDKPGGGKTNGEFIPPSLAVYYFDKDNVVIGQTSGFMVKSEITGVKGDAFRLEVAHPIEGSTVSLNVVKAEIRSTKRAEPAKENK